MHCVLNCKQTTCKHSDDFICLLNRNTTSKYQTTNRHWSTDGRYCSGDIWQHVLLSHLTGFAFLVYRNVQKALFPRRYDIKIIIPLNLSNCSPRGCWLRWEPSMRDTIVVHIALLIYQLTKIIDYHTSSYTTGNGVVLIIITVPCMFMTWNRYVNCLLYRRLRSHL